MNEGASGGRSGGALAAGAWYVMPPTEEGTPIDAGSTVILPDGAIVAINLPTAFSEQEQIGKRDFDEDREGRSPNFVFVSMPGAFVDGRLNPKSVDFIDAPWIDELLDTEVNTETCFIQRIIPPSIDRRSVFAFHNDDNEDVDSIYRCFTLALSVFLQDRTDLNLEDWRREVSKLFQNY